MGWFTSKGKKSVSESPEINVKTKPLIKPGWWLTNRLPKPHRSQQPHLSDASHSINSASTFIGSAGTYSRSKRSDSMHQNAASAFQGHEETYRVSSISRTNSYGQSNDAPDIYRTQSYQSARGVERMGSYRGGDANAAAMAEAYRRKYGRYGSEGRLYSTY